MTIINIKSIKTLYFTLNNINNYFIFKYLYCINIKYL